jgi:hypothetical protein
LTSFSEWRSLTYSPELKRLVACSVSGQRRIMLSDDGINWRSAQSIPISGEFSCVLWCPPPISKFIITNRQSASVARILYSDDGNTWLLGDISNNSPFDDVVYDSKRERVYATSETALNNWKIWTSTNGINYTQQQVDINGQIRGACYSKEQDKIIFCCNASSNPQTRFNIISNGDISGVQIATVGVNS